MAENHSQFVLRLLVVKVEGVLVPPVSEWSHDLEGVEGIGVTGDELFPDWVSAAGSSEQSLRNSLEALAKADYFQLDESLEKVMNYAHGHSPVRVALLSSGPGEWLEALSESLGVKSCVDLHYSYDRYTKGSRRTLLQFLMNRFIAGRERTLLLGNTLDDERLADREQTRFRSFKPPPDESLNPRNWGWSGDRLLEFIRQKQPEN